MQGSNNGQEIQGFIFDLGNVLVRLNSSFIPKVLVLWKGESLVLNGLKGIYDQWESGRINTDSFIQAIQPFLPSPMDRIEFEDQWRNVLAGPVFGMESILKRLRRKFRLALLSNVNPVHWEIVLKNYKNFLTHFEALFPSFQTGNLKPSPESYLQVARFFKVEPSRLAFVDDRSENVEAAQSIGILAHHFESIEPFEVWLREKKIL
jgi:putative hydrolase of the HAD superfamily